MVIQYCRRTFFVSAVAAALLVGPISESREAPAYRISKDEQTALDGISLISLQGNLAFLASDALLGRGTPSIGLDVAAHYIAEQFRHAGWEPIGDDGYFQTADWVPPRRRMINGVPDSSSPAAGESPAKVRNVIGILRGSDAKLADTYVLLTAHYDHLGTQTAGEGDRIFNGANDDASGVVSVIELARVLAALKNKPKRSIVFMAFYGEERGLVGSRYYGAHPLVPIDKTIANINIEQVGRIDDKDNPGRRQASVTGMDYSEVGGILQLAGRSQGVRIFKHELNSDPFFSQSDNRPLADLGVPAHTVSCSYFFPDAHKVADEEDKIDYANMAQIDRAIGLATLMIANASVEPQWLSNNPNAAKYAAARNAHRAAVAP
jgi:hypothetical protein